MIESTVPFGRTLHNRLFLDNIELEKLVRDHNIERRYLAWETVRKRTNPYFVAGTGFEGYYVSRCPTPDAALSEILDLCQNMLDSIGRLYRFEYSFRSRLMKTLMREQCDVQAVHVWSETLGANLGRLRAQVLHNPDAERFRDTTYRIVSHLPQMRYVEESSEIAQVYAVGQYVEYPMPKVEVTTGLLNPSQQDAWLVAEHIGEFGHPLVRQFLDVA